MRLAWQDMRYGPTVAFGGLISFALFFLMHQLVATNAQTRAPSPPPAWLHVVRLRHQAAPAPVRREPPKPPPQVVRPRAVAPTRTPETPQPRRLALPGVKLVPGEGSPGVGWFGPAGPAGRPGRSAPVAPRFMIKPLYPPVAEYRGVQGTVTTCFTVAADGSVRDPRVVRASSPAARRYFAEAALRAVAQWKYFPRTVDGRPIATSDVCDVIRFRLDGSDGSA